MEKSFFILSVCKYGSRVSRWDIELTIESFPGGEVKRCSHLILIVDHFSYNFTWHWYVDCYLFLGISIIYKGINSVENQ